MSNMKIEHEGYGKFHKAKLVRYGKEDVYLDEQELLQIRDYLNDARGEGITFTALRKEVLAGRRKADAHQEHLRREAALRDQEQREKDTQREFEQAQAALAKAKAKAEERAKAKAKEDTKPDMWAGVKRYRQEVKDSYGNLEERRTAMQEQREQIQAMKAEAERLNSEQPQ